MTDDEKNLVYVLLVEDDRDDFFLTQDVLQQVKDTTYRVVWAGSYERAAQELLERRFDVALVDYQIGGRTGLEFIRDKASIFPHCPMILITGLRDFEIDRMAEQAGAADYLPKDSLTPELLDRSIRYARGKSQRHALLHTVIASTSTGIVALDTSDKPVVWNLPATRALGLPEIPVSQQSVQDVSAAVAHCTDGVTLPTEVTNANGEVFELSVSEVDRGGRVLAFHNVTKRAQAEQLLRSAIADAEAANAAKSVFLASMSHELRTPLNGILGMTGLLEMGMTDPASREYLSTVKSSAHDLLRLINSLLDLSKIEAGKMEIDDLEFEIEPTIESVISLLAPTARAKGLDIACYVDPRLPRQMRGDPHRLKQIITNLIGNAIKFTETGCISVKAHVDRSDASRSLKISVTDTGPGIPADKMGLLFGRFNQLDVGRSRKYDGTGLGLALCKELLQLMNGSIVCESVEGEGSTFQATLPLPAPDSTIESAVETQLMRLKGRRVLAVGVGMATADALSDYCAAHGWELTDVADCNSPTLANETQAFDAVLIAADAFRGDRAQMLAEMRRLLPQSTREIHILEKLHTSDMNANRDGIVALSGPFVPRTFASLRNAIAKPRTNGNSTTTTGRDPNQGLRIMLVEDNLSNRTLATMMLRASGYAITTIENGELAVKAATEREWDVILMDLHMPRMDGLEATRRIRQIKGREFTPIIGLTASAMREDREACLAAGMTEHMGKPVEWDVLVQMLKAIEKEASAWAAA
jgi:signal transduction histidine kinase